jgi:hypothetical protein
MRFHKLRIAWSVACSVACLLLIVLWMQSYWWHLSIVHYGQPGCVSMSLSSRPGGIEFGTTYYVPFPLGATSGKYWNFSSSAIEPDEFSVRTVPFVRYLNTGGGGEILVPFWVPTLICAVVAAVPWIPCSKRFGLRTLLIATTLVAVVLGVIVILSR